jgi:hypothetical protein
MKDRFWLHLFPVLGLILISAVVFFSVLANTEAQESGPPGTASIPAAQGGNPQGLSSQEVLTMTRWIALDGSEPVTFAEWQARRPPPPNLSLEQVYAPSASSASDTSDLVACVLVNPNVYDGIAASLAQWTADVEGEGWGVVIYSASFPDPSALRNHLASVADLDGCLLIGDFPVPWYEVGDKQFPMDVYYMDLNGVWSDADLDGVYDDHTGDVGPEIWIGRLLASNLDFGDDEIALLNNYFAKNHAYRVGSLSLPSRALVYLDDDWEYAADNMREYVAQLYPDTTVISDPNTTTAADYGQRLVDYYAWVHVFAHSTAFYHNFTYQEGKGPIAIYNEAIYRIDPHTFFYNLFACGAARFVERNYLAGWYVFSDTYGLLAIGTTTSGGMVRGFDLFYGPLAQGMPLGQAYRDWFEVEGVADQNWHYGLTLHGDPTLTITTEEQVGEAPASVAVTGPTAGDLGTACTFTATVDPATATQPLMYEWQATGQIPATHNSGQSDTATFTWWNTPGTKTITVTVTNFEGAITNTHSVTIEAPEIQVTPSSYQETLALGAVLTRTLTLDNLGPGRLSFELAEGAHAPLPGSGPDSFGYTYKDSSEADGPTYGWIEIAPPAGGSGTEVDLPTSWQGGYFWPISLPFTFNFYGVDYTELAIGSRGTLSFGDRAIGRENLPLPSPRIFEVETFIAPFWDFLVIDPGAVYYQALDSMFIVEYYQVSRYGGFDGTWEIILFENGSILFQYQDMDFAYYWGNYGRSATVGIQGDAITGSQYSYETAVLSDGLSICFAYPGQLPDCSAYTDMPWLSQNPIAGAAPVDGAQFIDIVFDAGVPEVTQPGEYQATLVIVTNDPDESLVMMPVTMTVIPPTFGLAIAPLVDARSGYPGTTVTYTLQVTNTGNTFDAFGVRTGGWIWPTMAPTMTGRLAAGGRADVGVAVSIPLDAAGIATDTAVITITSRADSTKLATVKLITQAQWCTLFLPVVVKQL